MNTDITPPQSTTPASTSAPIMDVQAPTGPVPEPSVAAASLTGEPTNQPGSVANVSKPPRPHSGVGIPIAATVIIVLGLATLATYAYLKTR